MDVIQFADRADAGRRLAALLDTWRDQDAIVCGIPRGGVVVAAEVAAALSSALDVAVVRKLGAPSNQEFAVGAIADGVRVVSPGAVQTAGVTPEQLNFVEDMERVELRRRIERFGQPRLDVIGRVVIVVDDGIATGATAIAACRSLRARGAAHVVLATPVAPAGWKPGNDVCDEYICLSQEPDFWAVGQFYDDFTQTSDGEVERLLAAGLP
ncbi:MAG TPA: phosphoribosyltransferase family protein [Microbacterium sp.]|uniref:phosphoribosyltransferase n=1 Tax=Microbacterium sp. TaxID=51671 RepID=UPI002CA91EDF|nr:phosphoribosyltransferase family protein [Microbacterium sp.]HWI30235.1 phosphoribosyltransferase family protein [Microbacterium sp.]